MGISLMQGFYVYNPVTITNPGLPTPNALQTVVTAGATAVNTGTTIYTTPANKTFYLLGFMIGNEGNPASAKYNITAGTAIIYGLVSHSGSTDGYNANGGVMLKAAAGTTIVFNHGFGAGLGTCTIWGWIE